MDQIICEGDSVSFEVVSTGLGLSYQWRKGIVDLIDGGTTSGTQTSILTINPVSLIDSGIDYNVVVSGTCPPNAISNNTILSVNACEIDLSIVKTASEMEPLLGSTVVFTIIASNAGTQIATGAEVSETLQSGFQFISATTTSGIYDLTTGIWTIGNMVVGSVDTLTITVAVVADGIYSNAVTIYATEPEVILSNNQSSIELLPLDFHIPEGFSPNGDLTNDLFIIRGIIRFPSNNFAVYNRWGNKVYGATPYKNTWDGKSESKFNVGGDVLPVGTYFYVLDLGDGTDVYKGTIYLNK